MYKIKAVTSMEKIFADREPSGEGFTGALTALRGETVSFQIACWQDGMRKQRGAVSVSCDQPGIRVRVRYVDNVPCAYPCHTNGRRDEDYLTDKPGLYPDPLREIPDYGFSLISGQWRSVWVDLMPDESAGKGRYPVTIHVISKGENGEADSTIGSVTVCLEVLNAALPELDIPHTEWFHCDCLANYYHTEVFSERHWQIIENFLRTAAAHHCNMILTPIFTPPLDTAIGGERRTVQLVEVAVRSDGTYAFGYDRLERWISMCRRLGFQYFELSHLFSQWGAVAAPKIVGCVNGAEQKLFGWDTDATGPVYQNFLHQFLPSLKQELSKLGVLDQTYFHISDEPSGDQLESYRRARASVEKDLAGCHTMDALSDYSFYQMGLVETPVCATNHIKPFLENRPPHLFGYYCTAQWDRVSNRFIVQPGYRTRALGMQLYKENIDGFLHWGYNFYNSEYSLCSIDPFTCTDADGAFPSGDPFIVYPGADAEPVESLRLMLMDEAFSDFCAARLLEKITSREEVLRVLDPDDAFAIDRYPRSCSGLQAARDRVNERLRELL